MKEKLSAALGTFGLILWYIISILYEIAPLVFLRFPFWVDLILIIAMTSLPYIGDIIKIVLYIWAFTIVIKGPIDAFAIVFFVFFALYVLTTLLPMIVSLFASGSRNDDL